MASGGLREGAGRPKGAKNKTPAQGRKTPYKNITVSGSPEEIEELKKLAEASEKSLSRFVLESLLGQ